MWYDPYKTQTHNALINMVLGPRGYGKTYGLKKLAIKNALEKGKQFIYLRRYQAELDLVEDNLFDDIIINNEFPGHAITKSKEGFWMVDDVCMGYPMALSRANYYKSASFPLVNLIIFDEFIIDTSQNMRYLKNEVRKLLDLIETVDRMRDEVRVYMLANSISFFNPYTLYWNLSVPKGKAWSKAVDGLVLVELVGDDEEFRAKKLSTRFGRLTGDTEYGAYSINNKFLLDTDTFIEERAPDAYHLCVMQNNGNEYGVWFSTKRQTYYVSEKVDPYCKLIFSTTLEDHQPNITLLTTRQGTFSTLKTAFQHGMVRFETLKCKNMFMEVMKHAF